MQFITSFIFLFPLLFVLGSLKKPTHNFLLPLIKKRVQNLNTTGETV